MATMSVRVDDWLKAEIEEFWRTHGQGPSSGLRHVAQEWWAMQHFPAIVFRDGVSGRRAALREGPDVWEVVAVARDYGKDVEGFREHFAPFVPADHLDQALAYAERFPDAVDAMIEQNERVERMLATGK
ncbi:MAG TPA: hypothetical protein VFL93_13075 [Longimicrobiaceae bacterium]|nr:hypothetical protein [Longimicrobiaceae bacterium]